METRIVVDPLICHFIKDKTDEELRGKLIIVDKNKVRVVNYR
jgi:hypothetical protein